MAVTYAIAGGQPLRGAVELPPDTEVLRCALVLGALADGESQIAARVEGAELLATVEALRAFGAQIEPFEGGTRIRGRGLRGLHMPSGAVHCGRSHATLALLTGLLAAQPFGTRLLLDGAAELPPLEHLIGSLRARGAHVAATAGEDDTLRPPIAVAPLLPDEALRGIECALPSPDPLAKSALLLSGLFASGPTAVSEPLLSSDHLERMLTALDVPLRRLGSMSGFDPGEWSGRLPPFGPWAVPGSTTLAAFLAAAAAITPGSRVALRDVGWNPTRSGFFDALRLLGAPLLVVAKGDRSGREPIAEVQVRSGSVRGGVMGGEIPLRCADALPALCLLGARGGRSLVLTDGEPFASARDPIWMRLAELVRAFGAGCDAQGAGLSIHPAARLRAARIDAREDRRLALTAVIFGLAAEGETLLHNARCLDDVYPGWLPSLRALGASIAVKEQES